MGSALEGRSPGLVVPVLVSRRVVTRWGAGATRGASWVSGLSSLVRPGLRMS